MRRKWRKIVRGDEITVSRKRTRRKTIRDDYIMVSSFGLSNCTHVDNLLASRYAEIHI